MKISAFLWRCLSRSLDGEGTSRHQAWDRNHVPGFLLEGFRLLEGKGKEIPPLARWKERNPQTGKCCDMVLLYISITKTHQTCEVKIPISVVSMRNILYKAFKKLQRILHIYRRMALRPGNRFVVISQGIIRNQTWLKSHVNIRKSWCKHFFFVVNSFGGMF